MKIRFFTIVLDGWPHIERIYTSLKRLTIPWEWVVVEGVAAPAHCTWWCARLEPRLSVDGTNQFIDELVDYDRRVKHVAAESWPGKASMCNRALVGLCDDALVWQIDSDEFWEPEQIEECVRMFEENPDKDCAYFWCEYFVGPDIKIVTRDTYGNHSAYEWLRVWRWKPGQTFTCHEPPAMLHSQKNPFLHAETEARGLVFRHDAYSTEQQVAFKEQYYGSRANALGHLYRGAVDGWKRLQQNDKWPARLVDYMPWVGEGAMVERAP